MASTTVTKPGAVDIAAGFCIYALNSGKTIFKEPEFRKL